MGICCFASLTNLSIVSIHTVYFHCRAGGAKQPQFRISNQEGRDNADDEDYWQKYTQVINVKKEKLWDALVDSLDKYRYARIYIPSCCHLLRTAHVRIHSTLMRRANSELVKLNNWPNYQGLSRAINGHGHWVILWKLLCVLSLTFLSHRYWGRWKSVHDHASVHVTLVKYNDLMFYLFS